MRLKILKSFSFCLLLLLLPACSGYSVTGGAGPTVLPRLVPRIADPLALVRVNTVLLLPLSFGERTRALNQRSREFFSELQTAAAEELGADLLASKDALQSFDWDRLEIDTAELKQLAQRSQADALLVTNLNNLVERAGSKFGSEQGAQVSFEMRLLRAGDLREIWSASYFFQDRALSENLFRAKERLQDADSLGWQTSERVLQQGFRAALRDLSQRRQSQFVG